LPFLWNTISIGFERQPAFLRDAERDGLVFLRAVEKSGEDVDDAEQRLSDEIRLKRVG
jgi:hypothetical protein